MSARAKSALPVTVLRHRAGPNPTRRRTAARLTLSATRARRLSKSSSALRSAAQQPPKLSLTRSCQTSRMTQRHQHISSTRNQHAMSLNFVPLSQSIINSQNQCFFDFLPAQIGIKPLEISKSRSQQSEHANRISRNRMRFLECRTRVNETNRQGHPIMH